MRGEILKAKTLTKKPFGVNVYYLSPYGRSYRGCFTGNVRVITTGAGNPANTSPN